MEREISADMNATLKPSGYYINNKLYIITCSDLECLLSLLNSKQFKSVLLSDANLTGGKGVDHLSSFGIPLLGSHPWNTLVDRVLLSIKEGCDTDKEESFYRHDGK
jgi:hypothetical protein